MAKLLTILFLAACIPLIAGCIHYEIGGGTTATSYNFDDPTLWNDIGAYGPAYEVPSNRRTLVPITDPAGQSAATIYGMYIGDTSRIRTDTVILYLHGLGSNMPYFWPRARTLAAIDTLGRFGVLMIDYRGYGMSGGVWTEDNMYADVAMAIRWLQGRGLDSPRLIVYGFSLGAAAAIKSAAEPGSIAPAKVIAEAPFASTEAVLQDAVLINVPGATVTDLKLDNSKEIEKVRQPYLWLHGAQDDFIYPSEGRRVFDNYHGVYGQRVLVPNADHGNVPSAMGLDAYRATLLDFITHN